MCRWALRSTNHQHAQINYFVGFRDPNSLVDFSLHLYQSLYTIFCLNWCRAAYAFWVIFFFLLCVLQRVSVIACSSSFLDWTFHFSFLGIIWKLKLKVDTSALLFQSATVLWCVTAVLLCVSVMWHKHFGFKVLKYWSLDSTNCTKFFNANIGVLSVLY